MDYSELKIVLLLKKEIVLKDCGYILSRVITEAMSKNDELLKYHNDSGFKYYCFDSLYPLAKSGVYEKGNLYSFRLRCVRKDFISKVKKELFKFQNDNVKIITVEEKKYNKRRIEEIISLTPIVITLDSENKEIDVNKLGNIQDDIIKNLVKKYNSFYNDAISYEAAANIFLSSKVASKPIAISYKGISLLGIKYRFKVSPDNLSQKLAFFAEATGLGEKSSSCGAGFCHAIYEKEARND